MSSATVSPIDQRTSSKTQVFETKELLGWLNEVEQRYAPEILYVAGDHRLLRQGRRVSVVGSRQASKDALKRARKLTKALVQKEVTVVSGLAKGIDTVAHSTALDLGGRTVAVLGTPISVTYPRSNVELHRRIIRRDAAVSQFAEGTPTRRMNFPMRNRTMALLSDATVIVSAGERSGTQHQGWEALRLGRDLLLLKSLAESRVGWVHKLRGYGAQVLEDSNLEYWLESLCERSTGTDPSF